MTDKVEDAQMEALKRLREAFPPNQVSMLPKPTKSQTDEVKRNFKSGVRCDICGGWHHPKVVHLAYVGHAALTDRFLDVDPFWSWEPLATDENGLPAIDRDGGLWIRLTVAGMTRIGYGDAPGKMGGDAMKERIGDALRNAGMRFGCALDLWHKGDLHAHEVAQVAADVTESTEPAAPELPEYPQSRLEKKLPEFRESLKGDATPEDIIGFLETKYTLTDEQRQQIRNLAIEGAEA
jgi:hypothetical protein